MRFLLLLSSCLLLGCSPESAPDGTSTDNEVLDSQNLTDELLGTWEIIEMKVEAPTYLGLDTLFKQHITEADWNQVYGIKPARTVFTSDGKLKRTLYLKNGQITDVVNGLWRIKNDSLQVIEPNITLNYAPTLTGEMLKLKGLIDYDRDGEVDDDYEANYRLVARTTN